MSDERRHTGSSKPLRICGARARTRGGLPCQARPVKGKKRCRMHGGLSTGPRTAEGLERCRKTRWKHGRYSREAIEARRRANWETVDEAKERFRRESRRADFKAQREAIRLGRQIDRWIRTFRVP